MPARSPQSAIPVTATTMPWPKPSTGCSRPNWSATAAPGRASTTWRSLWPSTSTGPTIDGCAARSAWSRQPSTKTTSNGTTPRRLPSPRPFRVSTQPITGHTCGDVPRAEDEQKHYRHIAASGPPEGSGTRSPLDPGRRFSRLHSTYGEHPRARYEAIRYRSISNSRMTSRYNRLPLARAVDARPAVRVVSTRHGHRGDDAQPRAPPVPLNSVGAAPLHDNPPPDATQGDWGTETMCIDAHPAQGVMDLRLERGQRARMPSPSARIGHAGPMGGTGDLPGWPRKAILSPSL